MVSGFMPVGACGGCSLVKPGSCNSCHDGCNYISVCVCCGHSCSASATLHGDWISLSVCVVTTHAVHQLLFMVIECDVATPAVHQLLFMVIECDVATPAVLQLLFMVIECDVATPAVHQLLFMVIELACPCVLWPLMQCISYSSWWLNVMWPLLQCISYSS